MKTLTTQFERNPFGATVATPTCSSCCCCCCCLAATISTSSLLAQRINKEAKAIELRHRRWWVALAALFLPITGGITYVFSWIIPRLTQNCWNHFDDYSGDTLRVCAPSDDVAALIVVAAISIIGFVALLYWRVKFPRPLGRAVLVTVLYVAAFMLELIGGAALILTGAGGVVYLILVPVIVGWISAWYHRHLGKDMPDRRAEKKARKAER